MPKYPTKLHRILKRKYYGPFNPIDDNYLYSNPPVSGDDYDAQRHDLEVGNNYGYLWYKTKQGWKADTKMINRSWKRFKNEGNWYSLAAAAAFKGKQLLNQQFNQQFFTQSDGPAEKTAKAHLRKYKKGNPTLTKRGKFQKHISKMARFKRSYSRKRSSRKPRKLQRLITRTIARSLNSSKYATKIDAFTYSQSMSSYPTFDFYFSPEATYTTTGSVATYTPFSSLAFQQVFCNELFGASSLVNYGEKIWLLKYYNAFTITNTANTQVFLTIYTVVNSSHTSTTPLEVLDDASADGELFTENTGSNIASVNNQYSGRLRRTISYAKQLNNTKIYKVINSYNVRLQPNDNHTIKRSRSKPMVLNPSDWRSGYYHTQIPHTVIRVHTDLTANGGESNFAARADMQITVEKVYKAYYSKMFNNQSVIAEMSVNSGADYNYGTDPQFMDHNINLSAIPDNMV